MNLRNAAAADIDRLARIWYDGWQDGHAAILPAELARLRTLASFRDRLVAAMGATRVAEVDGEPVGFCIVKADELYQLFVSAVARGSGVAAALVADAERRLARAGVSTAWLACAIGNDRAARFYEKCGWRRIGTEVIPVETEQGPYALEVWRYEKPLGDAADGNGSLT
ncbi:GNAT family N-acetyltransferase [Lysobacter solisilvae (ex Woo and Kim 2020)]|uniref:GNAT family N-acetyltransferase n=1 Tax=Agrilutibacter terrestris TaxID=2865112 RepID=A0A7H0FWZ9_9GAMM|nr:GNAT family N-acetyltransferase [Lysobacter terrestris]QNP40565.1 GNAT family N-acetyltransferase [Lysobacter terrestris]